MIQRKKLQNQTPGHKRSEKPRGMRRFGERLAGLSVFRDLKFKNADVERLLNVGICKAVL